MSTITEEVIGERKAKRLVATISQNIKKSFVICKGPHNKRIIMEKVFGDFDLISSNMPQSFLPPKDVLAT